MEDKFEYMITRPEDLGDIPSIEGMNTFGHNGWDNYAAYLDKKGTLILLWKRIFKFRE